MRVQVELGELHVPVLDPRRVLEPGPIDRVTDRLRRAQIGAEEDPPVRQFVRQFVQPLPHPRDNTDYRTTIVHRDLRGGAYMRGIRTDPLSFDPVVVGNRETDAWAAYYRHEWRRFLVASVGMVAAAFGMITAPHPGRSLVRAACQPDMVTVPRQPAGRGPCVHAPLLRARRTRHGGLELDPARGRATRGRVVARSTAPASTTTSVTQEQLEDALVDLYSYVYDSEPRGGPPGRTQAGRGDGPVGPLGPGRPPSRRPAARGRAARAGRVVRRSPRCCRALDRQEPQARPPVIGRSRWATPGPPYG